MLSMITKKEIIREAIRICGEPFTQKKVQEYLFNQGIRVSTVYIYSVKREIDGLPPYDQRNLILGNQTKTQLAEDILNKNPSLTGEQLQEQLKEIGVLSDIRHTKRIVASRKTEKKPLDPFVVVKALAAMIGLQRLIEIVETLRREVNEF